MTPTLSIPNPSPGVGLNFDPATHSYTVGGRKLPSVTQVIHSVLPQREVDDYYLGRGHAVHHGCRLLDEGRLDWSSVAPEIEPQMRAWEKFRREYPAKVIASELPLHHPIYGFAGTLDRALGPDAVVIVDIKASIAPQVRLQLGAYKLLWEADGRARVRAGAAVELSGKYRTLWLNEKEMELASRQFLACLTLHNFMQAENIKPQKEKTI